LPQMAVIVATAGFSIPSISGSFSNSIRARSAEFRRSRDISDSFAFASNDFLTSIECGSNPFLTSVALPSSGVLPHSAAFHLETPGHRLLRRFLVCCDIRFVFDRLHFRIRSSSSRATSRFRRVLFREPY
jgi:hypothetical protein